MTQPPFRLVRLTTKDLDSLSQLPTSLAPATPKASTASSPVRTKRKAPGDGSAGGSDGAGSGGGSSVGANSRDTKRARTSLPTAPAPVAPPPKPASLREPTRALTLVAAPPPPLPPPPSVTSMSAANSSAASGSGAGSGSGSASCNVTFAPLEKLPACHVHAVSTGSPSAGAVAARWLRSRVTFGGRLGLDKAATYVLDCAKLPRRKVAVFRASPRGGSELSVLTAHMTKYQRLLKAKLPANDATVYLVPPLPLSASAWQRHKPAHEMRKAIHKAAGAHFDSSDLDAYAHVVVAYKLKR